MQPDPAWSPEDHLERVYRRGRQLRRRRQLGTTSAVVAAVVGLAVMVGGGPTSTVFQPLRTVTGSGGGGGGSNNVETTEESSSTTTPDAPDRERRKGDDPEAAASATTAAPRSARATTTTAAATSATTVGPIAGTTPPPTSPIGDCRAGDLTWTTATNKSSYRAGDTVTISLHARNSSGRPCYAPRPCGAGVSATVTDSSGGQVWQGSSSTPPCDFGTTSPLLNPQDSYSYGTAGSWNQTASSGARAPVGTYRATARRGGTTANGATFALR